MATPHVAGDAALFAANNPSASPAQVKSALQQPEARTGFGRHKTLAVPRNGFSTSANSRIEVTEGSAGQSFCWLALLSWHPIFSLHPIS
jgi:subtilisin family serine protease